MRDYLRWFFYELKRETITRYGRKSKVEEEKTGELSSHQDQVTLSRISAPWGTWNQPPDNLTGIRLATHMIHPPAGFLTSIALGFRLGVE